MRACADAPPSDANQDSAHAGDESSPAGAHGARPRPAGGANRETDLDVRRADALACGATGVARGAPAGGGGLCAPARAVASADGRGGIPLGLPAAQRALIDQALFFGLDVGVARSLLPSVLGDQQPAGGGGVGGGVGVLAATAASGSAGATPAPSSTRTGTAGAGSSSTGGPIGITPSIALGRAPSREIGRDATLDAGCEAGCDAGFEAGWEAGFEGGLLAGLEGGLEPALGDVIAEDALGDLSLGGGAFLMPPACPCVGVSSSDVSSCFALGAASFASATCPDDALSSTDARSDEVTSLTDAISNA